MTCALNTACSSSIVFRYWVWPNEFCVFNLFMNPPYLSGSAQSTKWNVRKRFHASSCNSLSVFDSVVGSVLLASLTTLCSEIVPPSCNSATVQIVQNLLLYVIRSLSSFWRIINRLRRASDTALILYFVSSYLRACSSIALSSLIGSSLIAVLKSALAYILFCLLRVHCCHKNA